jgi:predicted RNase H-like HicB family nuclease
MRPFTVVYQRDETGWWVAQVKEVPAAITQGRTVAEARRRIREALAAALDSDSAARRASLVDDVRLPRDASRALDALALSRARLERERHLVAKALDEATHQLIDRFGLSVRDAGELLGFSHQRIQQLRAAALVTKSR